MNSGELLLELQRVNTLGTALYLAAHPDDENTEIITWLGLEEKARVGYLSLTRGDGGQNLIGTEISELLGLIRTQELLAARRIDKGEQFFTRAVDFGYSKTPEETFNIWNRDSILADVVWVIRKFRPDVIITRFPPPEKEYNTHGHHTASAILAEAAFEAAGDPNRFPEQLQYVEPFQPKRLYWNTSTWFYTRSGIEFDPEGKIPVNVGEYNPLLGKSYTQIAAQSRSQHRSQGFGAPQGRGEDLEYLEYVAGDRAQNDIFEGVPREWKDVTAYLGIKQNRNHKAWAEEIDQLLDQAVERFDPQQPHEIVDELAGALQKMQQLRNGIPAEKRGYIDYKIEELKKLIAAAAGLHFEFLADDYMAQSGEVVDVTAEVVKRSPVEVTLDEIYFFAAQGVDSLLPANELKKYSFPYEVHVDMPYTEPYWLQDKQPGQGRFAVNDQTMIGKAENDRFPAGTFVFDIQGTQIAYNVPLQYKWTDRVRGELYRDFVITPPVTAHIESKVYIFPEDDKQEVRVTVKAFSDNITANVKLNVPSGWQVEPQSLPVSIPQRGEERIVTFQVKPPDGAAEGDITAVVIHDGNEYTEDVILIDYEHIPVQTLFPPATARVVKMEVKTKGDDVGYIMGAGDVVPNGLQQLGYDVTLLSEQNMADDLDDFDAIIIGIRAFNTHEWLTANRQTLLDYVREGGNLIVQYQTTWGLLTNDFGPYPFTIGRERITDETADLTFVNAQDPLLNSPNKIDVQDLQGWVQERGLYFAQEWSPEYRTIFRGHDPGEDPVEGAVIVADYGEGAFIYTGISFFRQLPAGVPGAFKLLANMIGYEHDATGK